MANENENNSVSIKDFILPTNGGSMLTNVVKKQYKKNIPTYEVASTSGVDTIIKRTLNKDVSYMCLLVSLGQFYIKKEKTGELIEIDLQRYRTFWSGLESAESVKKFDECQVFNYFSRSNDFTNAFFKALKHPAFILLAKAGLCDMNTWVNVLENSSYHANRTSKPWWRGGYYHDEKWAPNKVHIKLIQYAVAKCVEAGGISREDVIKNIYSDSSDKLNAKTIRAFMGLCNMYCPEVARKAIDMYFDNDMLSGLSDEDLQKVWSKSQCETGRYRYGGYYNSDKIDIWNDSDTAKMRQAYVKFDANTFLDYMFYEPVEKGFTDSIDNWLQTWADTLYMEENIYGKIVDKYPDDLINYHNKLSYRYRIGKKIYDKMKFQRAIDRIKVFEESNDEWVLLAPTKPDDFSNEAQQMSNCVASYVQRVIDGNTNVMFLRKKADPTVSVCTVEINNAGQCVQFKAKRNADPSEEMYKALISLLDKNRRKRKVKGLDDPALRRHH